ncbi:MAG: tRNA lysidine(34) synthetase TilS [Ruegeria sp.]
MTPDADKLRLEIRALLPQPNPRRLGVAVSGGGDSVALLYLLSGIAQEEGFEVVSATVDHGLRPEAASEAEFVAATAKGLGISHDILKWQGWDGAGNLQDQARQARYRLLTDWAKTHDIDAIALGHTADDQAETVLMRLSRASGVTGLSAMPATRVENGIQLLRPMLGITRARLREFLNSQGAEWIEDLSNQDTRFDRIKVRDAMKTLEPLGITAESLSRVAGNLTQAREALEVYTQESARKIVALDAADALIDPELFGVLPDEIARRLVVGIVGWISGTGYPPRQSAVDQVTLAIRDGKSAAISGCLLFRHNGKARFCRELNAVQGVVSRPGELWDRRWRLTGPASESDEIRALGEKGLLQVADWRASAQPRQSLLSSPSVWNKSELVAAPLAGFANGWRAELDTKAEEFYASFLSH